MSNRIEEIQISKFKATCLGVLERVRRNGTRIRVTRFGVPIADILPPAVDALGDGGPGCMRGTGQIVGDVVAPAGNISDWNALK